MNSIRLFFVRSGLIASIVLFLALAGSSIGVSAQNKDELCRGANLTFNSEAAPGKPIGCGTNAAGEAVDSEGRVNSLITNIVNIFSIIVGIVAVIMVIVGGFKFITSGGDSGKVTSARNTIVYAIVGLIIVALAQFIVKFVLVKLT